MEFDALSKRVIGAAIEVHRVLGPGLLESAYVRCLAREMGLQNLRFATQHPLPISYKGARLECGYRLDFLVENQPVVELKAVERILPIHCAQIISYIRLARVKAGLLINFNVPCSRTESTASSADSSRFLRGSDNPVTARTWSPNQN